MPRPKIRILPDKVFYKLWIAAGESTSYSIYQKRFLSYVSEEYINFSRLYGIDEMEAVKMLENIYRCANLSTREILEMTGKKKSEIRNIFCIQIRTLENWWGGKSDASGYIRLMFLRHFQILSLGKYIYLESEKERESLKPSVYQKHEKRDNIKEDTQEQKAYQYEEDLTPESIHEARKILEYEKYEDEAFEDLLNSLYPTKNDTILTKSEYSSQVNREREGDKNNIRELLDKTDYLVKKMGKTIT